jgi:hypothetical protein
MSQQIPLSNNDLLKLQVRLPCWLPVFSLPESEFPLEVAVLNGSSKEELRVVEAQPLGESQGYLIAPQTFCQLKLTNPTQKPVHVYMVGFDETGRFQLETLWHDQSVMLQGLPPTETRKGYVFKPQGKPGIREIRLFASPQQVPFFLFPAAPDAYGAQLDAIDSDAFENDQNESDSLQFDNQTAPELSSTLQEKYSHSTIGSHLCEQEGQATIYVFSNDPVRSKSIL